MTVPMAIVPIETTGQMETAMDDGITRHSYACTVIDHKRSWSAAIAASPTSGRVSRADLERAAEAGWSRTIGNKLSWADASEQFKSKWRGDLYAALRALGLSLGPGIQDEGEV